VTSKKQTSANQKNAKTSTGPRSVEGKIVSSRNALKHGLQSLSPVVPGVESPEDWEGHRDAVLDDLVPAGYLEKELAGRIAFILWRLRRVLRYETGVLTNQVETIEEDAAAADALSISMSSLFGDSSPETASSSTSTRMGRERSFLGGDAAERVQKHETHLERSLLRNLHEFQRLQSSRLAGGGTPPPVLDVNISSGV